MHTDAETQPPANGSCPPHAGHILGPDGTTILAEGLSAVPEDLAQVALLYHARSRLAFYDDLLGSLVIALFCRWQVKS